MAKPEEPSREDIERLAYLYWAKRGCPEDNGGEDWFRAEDDLRNGRARLRRDDDADAGER